MVRCTLLVMLQFSQLVSPGVDLIPSVLTPWFFSIRHCTVATACSWSTRTVCWIRTVCVNALQSCKPTWSSSRESWRERGRGAGSRWSRATPVWTVWVNHTVVHHARKLFPLQPHVKPHARVYSPVPPVSVQWGPMLRPLLFPRPGPETPGQ